jgi:hypothetical protein
MSHSVFQVIPVSKQSFFQRLFKQLPPENAIIEFNNLLADDILSIKSDTVSEIENRYGLILSKDFALNLEEFYAVYWNWYIKQNAGNAVIDNELACLRKLLDLSDETITQLEIKVGSNYFRKAVNRYVANNRLLEQDRVKLKQLQCKLKLPKGITSEIINSVTVERFEKFVEPIILKKRCTPDQEAEVNQILASFNIPEAKIKAKLSELKKYKKYWELEHLPLVQLPTDPSLQKTEIEYLILQHVSWIELRGSGQNKKYEQINYGTLFLTNKRLVFNGNTKNSVITYDKINGVGNDSRGITLLKDKGKDVILSFTDDKVIVEIVLKRLLKEYRKLNAINTYNN